MEVEQAENETKHESQIVLGDEEKLQVDSELGDGLREPNATFLVDLNLIIVVLSLSSIHNEDCLNLVDTEKKDIKDYDANKGKTCMPRLHGRKRETNDVKLRGGQPTPKDFRHCRKM